MPQETVEFSALVPREEYEFFKENFPQYGAVKWFINECLREFNAEVKRDPAVREKVSLSIQRMLDYARALAILQSAEDP